MASQRKRKGGFLNRQVVGTLRRAKNAARLMSGGRFTAPYEAPYELMLKENFLRLRRYPVTPGTALEGVGPILLVPPLMVTAQVYDISPPLSSVAYLSGAGLDVWLCDFGVPENEEGGMERTLDEHLMAIDRAIDFIVEQTGFDVHVAGYSQGGLFVYQVAAYRKSKGVASVVTFGSPVDFQRNLPGHFDRDLTQNVLVGLRSALSQAIDNIPGLPGSLTSFAFKAVSPRKEVRYLRMMLGMLDDDEALSKIEPMRRFLGGEGFVAWPGPAFRSFVDNVIVQNRMMVGGFVVNEKSVGLEDLTCPVLYFVGFNDEFARPPSVRAISRVTGTREVYEVGLSVGHFGLVVGSRAMSEVWSTVVTWARVQSGQGELPSHVERVDVRAAPGVRMGRGERHSTGLIRPADSMKALMHELLEDVWESTGDTMRDLTSVLRWAWWQVPRLGKLAQLSGNTRLSMGAMLEEQARDISDRTFVLWQSMAFSYGESNRRVNRLANALAERGVGAGDHVAVLMDNHPDYLTSLVALNRLGAVGVLLNAGASGEALEHALRAGEARTIIVDLAHLDAAVPIVDAENILLLGARALDASCFDFETLVSAMSEELRGDLEPNPGRADDLALLLYTSGTTGMPKAARITNRRWFTAATASAVAAGLSHTDTVYCCLPLYHATGLLLGAGGALVGGCRLAIGKKFSTSNFWADVHRFGVTVVFYVGEVCRYLISAPEMGNEKNHSIRLFMGNGLRADVWSQLIHRFGRVRILELYGSTEGNVVLANLTGEKVGSVGRVPLGLATIELVRYDVAVDRFERDEGGSLIPCDDDEPGMLLAKIRTNNPLTRFDGYTDRGATEGRIVRDAFMPGDQWFVTGDLLKRDEDGDFWFVDRVGDTFRWKGENVSTEEVGKVIQRAACVGLTSVYGVQIDGHEGRAGVAAGQLSNGHRFDAKEVFDLVETCLAPAARPRFIRIIDEFETTASYKVVKHRLQSEGVNPTEIGDKVYWYNSEKRTYTTLAKNRYKTVIGRL